ncbi:MAG: bifunctional phosphoribosylaminoimidazolecarboxamide formyltransferase/IMP cyclohydrolase, partial [Planctomycetota bacterium]
MSEGKRIGRCALISVTDKTGVVELAKGLVELGLAVLSTGGTFKTIRDGGVAATEVADYTGFPEMMDGRIKTLHPKVHGGILARREESGDMAAMKEHAIAAIDVVVVNLYPFRETVRTPGVKRAEVVENIDIGGPTMLRSAAKNHEHVFVVVDPDDYPRVVRALRNDDPEAMRMLRRELAGKAFAHTSSYDTAIAGWFSAEMAAQAQNPRFGQQLGLVGEKVQDLRYGENPHQQAAFFRDPDADTPNLATAQQLCGKELSYNNILDLDAALQLATDFDEPCCAIIKHNNPCGTATARDLATAFVAALEADPLSAFGGVVAVNRNLDAEVAQAMAAKGTFLEAIVAPQVEPAALEVLGQASWGKNVRVMSLDGLPGRGEQITLRQVSGGCLAQTNQPGFLLEDANRKTVTRRPATDTEAAALLFAMRVCKHVKSNAIVLARTNADGSHGTVGVGAGQMSRVDAAKIAVEKAGDRANGAVLASDAFFPFADGLL